LYAIQDNGVGLDMKHAERIFGVFQRAHKDPPYPGLGTGLAWARRIISRHHGRIWCEARPGDGAAFHLSLPG